MPRDDRVRLRHMLDSAKEAIEFSRGHTRKDLDDDRLLALGLLKCLEIIGEAAARLNSDTLAKRPTISWQDIIGMRNRLVHVYFDIDLDVVWETVSNDLPPLVAELERILGPEPLP